MTKAKPAKLRRYSIGGIVDESIPDLGRFQDYLPDGFSAWLGPQLGWYRLLTEDGRETKSQNVETLQIIIERLDAIAELGDDVLPPFVCGLITQAAFREFGNVGVVELSNFDALRKAAIRAKTVCQIALDQCKTQKAITGRSYDTHGMSLYVAIVDRLNSPYWRRKSKFTVASEILKFCGIVPPIGNVESLRRAYRRHKTLTTEGTELPLK